MKYFLIMAFCLLAFPAYAGYDTIGINLANETPVDIDDVDANYKAFVYDTTNGNAKVIAVYDLAAQVETESVTAVNTITTAECGKTFYLNNATGFASTLPAPVAGCRFKFVNGTVLTSGNHTIVTPSLGNLMYGGFNELEVDTGDDGSSIAAGDTITFICAAAGLTAASTVGDFVMLESDGTSWFINGQARLDAVTSATQAD